VIDSPVFNPTNPTVSVFPHATNASATTQHTTNTFAPDTVKMKYLAAFLLLGLAGNSSPSAEDIKTVLSSVGIDADEERLSSLLKELEGKDINEVCSNSICENRTTPHM
jgi:large subunit ribosomal protein LP2